MYPPLVLIAHKMCIIYVSFFQYTVVQMFTSCTHGVGSTKRNKHEVRFSLCEKQREMLVSICYIIREEVNAATDKTTAPA